MSATQAAQFQALEDLLQAAPLSMRRLAGEQGKQGGVLATEVDTGIASDSPRGYAYDLEVIGGGSEPLTDLQFNQLVSVQVQVAIPLRLDQHRLDQLREVADLAETIRQVVLNSRTLDAKAEGLHQILRDPKRQIFVLLVPFGLRYEEDASE